MRTHPDTLPGVLERTARDHPTRPAVRSETDRLTYPELLEAALDGAARLVALGVRPGDTVALRLPNGAPWVVASYAVLCAGARLVPLNTRYTAAEARDIIARSSCRLVLAGDPALDGLADLTGPGARVLASLDDVGSGAADRAEAEARTAALRPETVSHVQYTSGTTGPPKGALLRHGALVETTRAWVAITGLRAGDVYPVVAPFAHIGGHKTGLLACAVAGATVLPVRSLDPAALARAVAERGVSVLQGPPALYRALLAEPSMPRDRVRIAVTGAAVVPRDLVAALRERLGVRHVFTAYGLTEASGVCTMTRQDDPLAAVAETAGAPIPGVEVRIDAPDGPGEILVRGRGLMSGYLGDPAATAEALSGGWLRTGDVGELDAAGRLRVVDRLKDVVIVGGLNVYPAEVEQVLTAVAGVRAAAVVGIAHDRLGEVPAAFVVGGGPVEEIVARCASRLAGFKVPRTIWRLPELPLNAAGKVDKPALRREAASRTGAP